MTTGNQDTPLPLGLSPVLNIDVWEHAYYLKHYNVRADYIDDWFHVVNWNNANKNYMRKTGMAASGSSSLAAPSKPYALHFQTR